jgi:hypothetical protein
MNITATRPNTQVKINQEFDNSNSPVVFIFSTETTSQEFEDYINSLMEREFVYGEPMY